MCTLQSLLLYDTFNFHNYSYSYTISKISTLFVVELDQSAINQFGPANWSNFTTIYKHYHLLSFQVIILLTNKYNKK
jgi:hypothetical protein